MNLHQIELFVAAARHNGFRRAAQFVHLSDSGLQKQVRKLEADLGVQLFEPDGRNVRLTSDGHAMLLKAEELLGAAASFRDQAQTLRGDVTARIRVATYPVHVTAGLARAAATFEAAHEGVQVDLLVCTPHDGPGDHLPSDPARLLLNGEVDFAVGMEKPHGVLGVELWECTVVVLLPKGHGSRSAPSVSFDDVKGLRVFAMPAAVWSRRRLEQAAFDAGRHLRVAGSGPTEMLQVVVDSGLGCAILGEDNLDLSAAGANPFLADVDGKPLSAPVSLMWRADARLSTLDEQWSVHVRRSVERGPRPVAPPGG